MASSGKMHRSAPSASASRRAPRNLGHVASQVADNGVELSGCQPQGEHAPMLPAPPVPGPWADLRPAYGGATTSGVHTPITSGNGRVILLCDAYQPNGGVGSAAGPFRLHEQRRSTMSYQAEYIWIDGTEPSPCCGPRPRSSPTARAGHLGFDGSSTNQATGSDSDCVLSPVFVCPDPLRDPGDKLVMCEVLSPTSPAPDQHPGQVPGGGREVRRPRALVRHRAGVTRSSRTGGPSAGRSTATPPPGPLLLRRRRRQDARPGHRRAPHQACMDAGSASRAPTPR